MLHSDSRASTSRPPSSQLVTAPGEDVFIVSKLGEHVRISVDEMPLKKRYQTGTKLLDMAEDDTVLGVAGDVQRERL